MCTLMYWCARARICGGVCLCACVYVSVRAFMCVPLYVRKLSRCLRMCDCLCVVICECLALNALGMRKKTLIGVALGII